MGASSEEFIRQRDSESKADDTSYVYEQYMAGPIEVTFSRTYFLAKTDAYEKQQPGEDIVDTIERLAFEMFEHDWLFLGTNDNDFNVDIK